MLHNKRFLQFRVWAWLSRSLCSRQQSRCQAGWISFRSLTGEESASKPIQVVGIIHFPEAVWLNVWLKSPYFFGGCQLPSGSSGFPQFHATWASPVWLLSSSHPLESVWLQPAETVVLQNMIMGMTSHHICHVLSEASNRSFLHSSDGITQRYKH